MAQGGQFSRNLQSGTSNTNSIVATVGAAGPGSIQVTASNTTCGNGTTLSLAVLVNSPSTAPSNIISNPSNIICSGNSVQLTVNGGSLGMGATWKWYDGGCGVGPLNLSGSSITTTPLQTTNYSVSAKNGCGSTNCASVTITVNQTPATPTPSPLFVEVCSYVDVQLQANVTGVNYLWSGPNGFSSTIQDPLLKSLQYGSGKYCLIVSKNNCPSIPGCDSIKVDSVTHTSINIWQDKCFDSSVVFYSSVTGGGNSPSYTWQTKANNSSVWLNIQNVHTDTLKLTRTANGTKVRCILTSSELCPVPVFAISDSNLVTCIGKKPPSIECLKEFSIIPNPSIGQFSIALNLGCQKTVAFELYSSSGQKIFRREEN